MNELLIITLNIFILILLGGLIENIISDNKFIVFVKPTISFAIILTIIVYVKDLKLNQEYNYKIQDYDIDISEVWDKQAENCEKILEEKMLEDCLLYNLNINAVDITVKYDSNNFKIEQIVIKGPEKNSAKNYISGKYNIGLAYISTDED